MYRSPRSRCLLIIVLLIILSPSCQIRKPEVTVLWTNRPEFAAYAEQFNSSQNKHRLVVDYKENPAQALISERNLPDLVVGSWLKGEKARAKLVPIDYLFSELRVSTQLFYQPLLDLGNIGGRQYLLPVSFNLPTVIFLREKAALIDNNFILELDTMRELASGFNTREKTLFTKMGFSPRWDREFLYLTTRLFDVRFQENNQLINWNNGALEETTRYIRDWTQEVNTSLRDEDDFQFKYLYDPPNKLVSGGRSLFAYMPSSALFLLPGDKLQNIDFRYLSRDNRIPVNEDILYIGICKRSRNQEAAEAFIVWFFNEKTQREMLERSRNLKTMQRSFGISGGFSSIRPVNEKVFPLYYPSLLGHLPPAESLGVPRILPNNWETIKQEIIIPYLAAATSRTTENETVQELGERIKIWLKSN